MEIVFIKRELEQPRLGLISWYMFFVVYVATYAIVYYLEEKIKDNDIIFGLLCTDPQKLDLKSNFWRSVFFWQNIVMNSSKKWFLNILKEALGIKN